VAEHLPEIPKEQIIGESHKKNTGPSIAYITRLLHERDVNAVAVIVPADHLIQDESGFIQQLSKAIEMSSATRRLMVFGVKPSWPATGYGYIRHGNPVAPRFPGAYVVERFIEKPNREAAEQYVQAGDHYWNAGMFVGAISHWLQEFALHMPALSAQLSDFTPSEHFRKQFFAAAESISIDVGLMEKSSSVAMCCCDVGWSDIGSWESLRRLRDDGVAISKDAEAVLVSMTNGDEAARLPCRIEKPWGHEELWARTAHYAGKILSINANHQLSYQYHRFKEETLRVLTGNVEIDIERNGVKQMLRLSPGDVLHVPPLTKHRLRAQEASTVLEVSTDHLDDVVRVEDDYGRT